MAAMEVLTARDDDEVVLREPQRGSETTTTSAITTTTTTTAEAAATNNNNNNNNNNSHTTGRNAVVLALFGPTVGPCVGDFATTYNRINGRLYASTKAILFYSNLFGFERRLCLLLSDVISIESYRSTSIRISMVDCEDHVFKKFLSREAVLNVLQQLLDMQADDYYELEKETGRISAAGMTRSLSLSRMDDDDDDDAEQEEEEEGGDGDDNNAPLRRQRPHLSSETTPEPVAVEEVSPFTKGHTRVRSQSMPFFHDDELFPLPPPPPNDYGTPKKAPPRRVNSQDPSVEVPDLRPIRKWARRIAAKANKTTSITSTTSTTPRSREISIQQQQVSEPVIPAGFDMQKAWDEAKQPYEEIVMEKMTFPCSLDAFMNLFFANEAPSPITKFQKETIGDKEIQLTKWKRHDSNNPASFDRSLRFIHPLKNALGPSQAQTTRQQHFQRFGSHGMTLQNLTTVEGIPAADCFRVEDRWTIEEVKTKSESSNSVTMMVSLQMIFTKRTMFKPIIQKNIRSEAKLWFQGYSNFVLRTLNEDEGKPPPSGEDVPEEKSPDYTTEAVTTPATRIAAILPNMGLDLLGKGAPILLILCLMFQMFFMQQSLGSLQNQVLQLQVQNNELVESMKQLLEKRC